VNPPGLKATVAEAATTAVTSAFGVISGIWGSVANNISVNYGSGGSNGLVYSGSSPPSGMGSGLMTYVKQNINVGNLAHTGATVSNGLNQLIDAGSAYIKGPHSKAKVSLSGVNVALDERIVRLEKSLLAISKLGANMEHLLQHDNGRLYEISQFSYHMKQLSDLDDDAGRSIDDIDGSTDVDKGNTMTSYKDSNFCKICDSLNQTIDNIAMSQQKHLEIQNFRSMGSLQYLGRYSQSLNHCVKQRHDALLNIESATEDRTARKEQLDAGKRSTLLSPY
jgi:hypothetical protein